MPFQAKMGGLRAAIENNLADKESQQPLTLAAEAGPVTTKPCGWCYGNGDTPKCANCGKVRVGDSEQFKTVRIEAQDYEGADKSASNCPTARAIARAMPKIKARISVWVDRVKIGPNLYALPAEVTEADRQHSQNKTRTLLEFQLSNRKVTA